MQQTEKVALTSIFMPFDGHFLDSGFSNQGDLFIHSSRLIMHSRTVYNGLSITSKTKHSSF